MLDTSAQAPSVEIFTGPNCAYCQRAKALLDRKGLRYREMDVSVVAHREELLRRLPRARSIPQIFITGTYVGGCEDLEMLAADGALDGLARK